MTVDQALVTAALVMGFAIAAALAEALREYVRTRREPSELVVTHVDHEKRIVRVSSQTPERKP